MRNSTIVLCLLAASALALLPACGGGGNGFGIDVDPLVITSSSVDSTLVSGDAIDWEIPLDGGCSGVGPYVVEVISGELPDGVGVDDENGRHNLVGFILEDGVFNFTIKITDTSCTPFATTTLDFEWDVPQGPVGIVACNPPLISADDFDDPLKYTDVAALETVVYGSFINYDFVVAGGVGPYVCALIDDPADPDDGPLPLGLSFAVNSCSLVGTPTAVGPAGRPFRYTIQVTDSVGNTSTRKFQHKIDTPPIIIPNTQLLDGQAGVTYSDQVTAVDGVPPLAYELTDNAPNDDGSADTTDNVNDNIDFTPGMTPTVLGYVNPGLPFQFQATGPTDVARLENGGAGRVGYPAATDLGPDYTGQPMPSEGIYMREQGPGNGTFFGIPRRRGSFLVNFHAYSTLVPNERGQHAFKQLPLFIADKPALEMDGTSWTEEGTVLTSSPFSTLPEAEKTVIYNGDATSFPAPGMELFAIGGVPMDNSNDQPHEDDLGPPLTPERADKYMWTDNMNFDGLGPFGSVADALGVYDEFGIFGTGTAGSPSQTKADALLRYGRRLIQLSVTDASLPSGPGGVNVPVTRTFGIAVGPDTAIITESSKSFTGTSTTSQAQTDMHDDTMRIKSFAVVGGSGTISALSADDLAPGTTIPAETGVGTTLKTLLSDTNNDLLRFAVNPNGWWNDNHNMHPKGARAATRMDRNTNRTNSQVNGYNSGQWQPGATDVILPAAPTAPNTPLAGIRNDGGRMYAFDNATHFGLFVIRRDASIYIPWATAKGNTASGLSAQKFGDGMVTTTSNSNLLVVPLSVSPDGRVGCVKIVDTTSTSLTTVSRYDNGRFVLFSLTGEAFGNGKTYCYVDPNLLIQGGTYLYSTSMTLTNRNLYFLSGNYASTYASWRDHYIHRFTFANTSDVLTADDSGGAPGADIAPGFGSNWTLTGSTPMQTPFHKWDNPASTFSTFLSTGGFGVITVPNEQQYLYDGWNMSENTLAPVPFRVSANGLHCALLAGPRTTSTSSGDVMAHLCWVDSGNGFRQASSNTKRHSPQGAGRGYSLRRGPSAYRHWGYYAGPTTAFEISDDGRNVAYTYNTIGSVSSTGSTSNWNNNREDVLAIRASGSVSDPWTSTTGEKLVTANTFGTTNIKWRFGSLLFTKDNDDLIFWGGASSRDATSSSASGSGFPPPMSLHFVGTYYTYDMTSGGSGASATVRGIMPTSAGGIGNFPTYTNSNPFAPTTGTYVVTMGTIKPIGGFMSANRDYFYVVNHHAITTSDQTLNQLLGINVENMSGSTTASNNVRGRGFKVQGQTNRRGFLPNDYYMPDDALGDSRDNPHHVQGGGMQRMNPSSGYVYFMSHYSSAGPSRSTSTSSFSSGPAIAVYWQDYGYRGMQVESFSANVGGPVQRLSHFSGDTSSRSGHYIESNEDGTKLAYVYSSTGTTRGHNRERVGYVRGIRFNSSTGAYEGDGSGSAFANDIEGGDGRAGESMAFDSGGGKLFYAYKSGSSNENDKELVLVTINPSTGARTYNRTVRTGLFGRYNVLFAGRPGN